MKFALLLLLFVQEESRLERAIRYANDSSRPGVMGQAIEKVVETGNDAVPAILAFVKKRGHNKLSIAFTDNLGAFNDDRIIKLCTDLIGDKDFFWRPAAARSLAMLAKAGHRELLQKLLTDHLWGVRAAAIDGLGRLKNKESIAAIQKLLGDEIYDVRAQAAKTLWAMKDESGLPILVEALRSRTTWFDIDYGQIAREDAWNFLKKISRDDFGFKPWEPEKRRAAGLKKWDEWMTLRDPDWRKNIPAAAIVKDDSGSYAFGFELRSCQKGDFFFRLDKDDHLVLGYVNLLRAKLTPEEKMKFEEGLCEVKKIDMTTAYGIGGCDFEQYYVRSKKGTYDKLWVGVGGRPEAIEGFIRTCRDLIRTKFGAGPAQEFAERTPLFQYLD